VNSMVRGMVAILRELPMIDVEMHAVDSFEEALALIQNQGSGVA